jgi:hypothetical protein
MKREKYESQLRLQKVNHGVGSTDRLTEGDAGTGTCFTQSRREYDSCWYSQTPSVYKRTR